MRRIPALLLFVAACTGTGERAEPLEQGSLPVTAVASALRPPDPQAWLALYDEAGFPDVSGLRCVEFEDSPGSLAWVLPTTPPLLLRDSLWTLAPEGVEIPEHMRDPTAEVDPRMIRTPPVFREVDFAEALRADLEAAEATEDYDPIGINGRRGPPSTYWLIRARWAQMRGLPELSRRALVQVERWATVECSEDPCTPEKALRSGIQVKLLWQATDGLGNFMPRPKARELLARARSIAPDGPATPLVIELLARVDQTIATDVDDPTWPAPDDPDRVERLIHLLREQNGQQTGQPGFCYPLGVPRLVRNPGWELAALGREAIPALIEHIDDDDVTRSVGYGRDFRFSHHVLSVGDVSLEIIEQIAGRSFFAPEAIASTMSEEGEAKVVQQRVRAWWADAREVSEREQLLHDLEAAEEQQRDRIARKLLDEYGAEIWPELVRAFAETRDGEARADLLNVMHYGLSPGGPVGSEPAAEREMIEQFLLDALEDRSASVRFAAARALGDRGRHEGTVVIIRDLDAYWLEPRAWSFHERAYASYFGVLLEDGSAAALAAIDRAIRRRGYDSIDALLWGGCWDPERCKLELDPAAKDRLLDTLADHLEDFGDSPAGSFGDGPSRARDKAAAAYLALTERDRPSIGSLRTSLERDRVILNLLNAHRARRGQAPKSWPHLAPLEGTPGRNHVQRVHLIRATAHEAAANEWLAGFADRDLDPAEVSTALVELARRHPDVPFILRVHRFPADAGVMLTLEVGPRSPGDTQIVAGCWGPEDCGRVSGSHANEDGAASAIFADFLHETIDPVWSRAPARSEEYVFRMKASSEPSGPATRGCACSTGDALDQAWLLLLAGLVPVGFTLRRRRSSAPPG